MLTSGESAACRGFRFARLQLSALHDVTSAERASGEGGGGQLDGTSGVPLLMSARPGGTSGESSPRRKFRRVHFRCAAWEEWCACAEVRGGDKWRRTEANGAADGAIGADGAGAVPVLRLNGSATGTPRPLRNDLGGGGDYERYGGFCEGCCPPPHGWISGALRGIIPPPPPKKKALGSS